MIPKGIEYLQHAATDFLNWLLITLNKQLVDYKPALMMLESTVITVVFILDSIKPFDEPTLSSVRSNPIRLVVLRCCCVIGACVPLTSWYLKGV